MSGRSASRKEAFWEQVNAALDARRDPLEVPTLQRLVAAEPALLGELVSLRSGLALVEGTRRRRVVLRVAAAVLVAAVGLSGARGLLRAAPAGHHAGAGAPAVSLHAGAASRPEVLEPGALPPRDGAADGQDLGPAPAPLRVLAFRAEVTVEGPRGRRTTTHEGRRIVAQSASRPAGDEAPFQTPLFLATASSVTLPR
jgi:hypothetical protein